MLVEGDFGLGFAVVVSIHLPGATAATVNTEPRRQIEGRNPAIIGEAHGILWRNDRSRGSGGVLHSASGGNESNQMASDFRGPHREHQQSLKANRVPADSRFGA